MAEKYQTTAGAPAEPAASPQQPRPCPRDCSRCGFQQHAFCAARMTFQMFEVMNNVITSIDLQSQRIYELEQRLTAIQGAGVELAAPAPVQSDLFSE